jgi:hypothetical protein
LGSRTVHTVYHVCTALQSISIIAVLIVATLDEQIAVLVVCTDIAVVTVFTMKVDKIGFGDGVIEFAEICRD